MKKIYILVLLLSLSIKLNMPIKAESIGTSFYVSAMYTDFSVLMYDGITQADKDHITTLIKTYDHLANNFVAPDLNHENSLYHLANLVTINENAGIAPVVVDARLYELLKSSVSLYEETNGYFNPAMGKVIDVWKSVINDRDLIYTEISPELYQSILTELQTLDTAFSASNIIFNDTDSSVYLDKPGLKIDLGAYAKGYVGELIKDYINEKSIERYIVNAGDSTVILGKHPDDLTNNRPLTVSLRDPLNQYQVDGYRGFYGVISLRNKSISTSGNNVQFVSYQGKRFHHIISPFDLVPQDYYHSVTLIGEDAGFLDALSTAIFNMPLSQARLVLNKFDVEAIFYLKNGTIVTHNLKSEFKMGTLVDPNRDLSGLYLTLGGVIGLGGLIMLIISIKDKRKKVEETPDV